MRVSRDPRDVAQARRQIGQPTRATVSAAPILIEQLRTRWIGLWVESEYAFHPTRRWRFDVAVTAYRLAIEVEGGVFIQGRHSRGLSFEADCEKYAEAMVLGWRVLRVTSRQVRNGQALEWISRILTEAR